MGTQTESGRRAGEKDVVGALDGNEANDAKLRLEALKRLRMLMRAAQRHSAWIEKQCGVSGAQLWMLQEIASQPGLRVGEVARRLAIHQPTASNLLEGLVKRGLVWKQCDAADQRVVRLVLSREGGALLARAPQPARGLFAEALAQLDGERLLDLVEALDALLEGAGQVDRALGAQPFFFML